MFFVEVPIVVFHSRLISDGTCLLKLRGHAIWKTKGHDRYLPYLPAMLWTMRDLVGTTHCEIQHGKVFFPVHVTHGNLDGSDHGLGL